jgi:cobalt-zinc-cadmium efflux system membrane fusion protein
MRCFETKKAGKAALKAALIALLILIGELAGGYALAGDEHGHGHGHDEEHHDEPEKGPLGGRLLEQDGFAIEIVIFESGVPPEFRLYAYKGDNAVAPQQVKASVTLERLGGEKNTFRFTPEADYLVGDGEVSEPHSFAVTVIANYNGKDYRWHYDAPEGRTQISERAAKAAGIIAETVAPAEIHDTLDLFARVELLPQNRFHVGARYAGIVQSVNVTVGDHVNAGDTIATIENSDTLQSYAVKAPASGVVLKRFVNKGDATGKKPLLTIADVSTVAVDMSVFAADRTRLAEGQTVIVRELRGERTATARIDHIAAAADNNVTHVHATLQNPGNLWRVGDAVRATVQIATHKVEAAVRAAAIQDFRGMEVVFAQYGDKYEVRMLETGRRDSEFVEVLGGIAAGTPYVTNNSYLVKADVLKSGASHDH